MKKELINKKNGEPFYGLFSDSLKTDLSFAKLKTKFGRKIPSFLNVLYFRQFLFTGINTKDFIAGIAVADVGYAAKGFFYIYDIQKNILHESSSLKFPFFKPIIKKISENQHTIFKSGKNSIIFSDTRISAEAETIKINISLEKNKTIPLRLCSKTAYNRWFFTKKQSLIPVSGTFEIDQKTFTLDSDSSMSLTDRSLGFPGREIWWNWASTSTVINQKINLGMNLSWGINQTGETENMVWFNDDTYKINQAVFTEKENKTWIIKTNDGIIDLVFTPLTCKYEKENFLFTASKFTQLIGIFKGEININDKKIPVEFKGWLEDHYVKW